MRSIYWWPNVMGKLTLGNVEAAPISLLAAMSQGGEIDAVAISSKYPMELKRLTVQSRGDSRGESLNNVLCIPAL